MNKETLFDIIKSAPLEDVLKFKVGLLKVTADYQNAYTMCWLVFAAVLFLMPVIIDLGCAVDNFLSRVVCAGILATITIYAYKIFLISLKTRKTIKENKELLRAVEVRIKGE